MRRLDLINISKELLIQKRARKNKNQYLKYLYWLFDEKKVIEESLLIELFDELEDFFSEEEMDSFFEGYSRSKICENFKLAPNIIGRRAI